MSFENHHYHILFIKSQWYFPSPWGLKTPVKHKYYYLHLQVETEPQEVSNGGHYGIIPRGETGRTGNFT